MIDLARHEASVRQTIQFSNATGTPLTELLLLVEANRRPGSIEVEQVLAGATPLPFTLEGRRLNVRLPEVLQPGAALELSLEFRLTAPKIGQEDYLGWLGYSDRQMNLGNWLPVVAPWVDGGWLMNETAVWGEHAVQEPAAWDVTVDVSGASEGLTIAGPGEVSTAESGGRLFRLSAARDFSLSIAPDFQWTETTLADGTLLEVYSLEDSPDALAAAAWALDVTRRSVQRFSSLFGPLPIDRLVVVEGDFPDGMEFTGLVFVSEDWFESWGGDPASYLTLITAHEVAHQWWYGLVASDQGGAPWLDEALATYSEYLLLESDYPQLTEWWWDWRINRFAPSGFVDSDVYGFASRRDYINAVYLRGARMFHQLRQDLGDDAFFDWLRRYASQGAGEIVTGEDLWALLDASQLEATRQTRQRFLRDPGP